MENKNYILRIKYWLSNEGHLNYLSDGRKCIGVDDGVLINVHLVKLKLFACSLDILLTFLLVV